MNLLRVTREEDDRVGLKSRTLSHPTLFENDWFFIKLAILKKS